MISHSFNKDKVPGGLTSIPHWVVWFTGQRHGKPTKIPYDANTASSGTLEMAKTNDDETWCHFATAIRVARDTDHGIGFVLTSDLGIVGIDLDHCVEGNKIEPWARKIVDAMNTYTEVSPSGTGIRMFVYGDIPKALKRDNIELYKHVRFLTVTGNRVAGCSTIVEERKGDIQYLYEAFKKPEVQRTRRERRDFDAVSDDRLVQLISDSKQGTKFRSLMGGDGSRYGSGSEADMALCCILCWWTGDDRQVESIMRGSELYREKYDRPDYLQRTIESARNKS
jgi:primase-polymerase (primpol)-like protein